jgi:hypothetical protein
MEDCDVCVWCNNQNDDLKRTSLGLVCSRCVRAIESRGECICVERRNNEWLGFI